MRIPLALLIMDGLALLSALVGLPVLIDPAGVRRRMAWRDTPQLTYILRITGAMLSALALILLVFSTAYWRYTR